MKFLLDENGIFVQSRCTPEQRSEPKKLKRKSDGPNIHNSPVAFWDAELCVHRPKFAKTTVQVLREIEIICHSVERVDNQVLV